MRLLPARPPNRSGAGAEIVPDYLDARDHGWIRLLWDEWARFTGRRRRELDAHLAGPLPFACPQRKRRLVEEVLDGLWKCRVAAPVAPATLRAALFAEATVQREGAVERVARRLGHASDQLLDALLADLRSERRLVAPDDTPDAAEIALRANLRLIQRLLHRSTEVRVQLEGGSRPVVRYAKLMGLICTLEGSPTATTMVLSGPLSLFRHTLVYGRSLAGLVPQLAWCNRFRLEAALCLGERRSVLRLSSGAPIFPAKRPKPYDSRIEERLARDFTRLAPGFCLVREPEPISAGSALIHPDFAIFHPSRPGERWFLEIVGFWTAAYLEKKLASLSASRLPRLILCIDERRNCDRQDFPAGAAIIRYRTRIDAAAVLAVVTGGPGSYAAGCTS